MSEKHTPGPWWTTDHGIRDRGGYIAHTNSVQRYEGQDERYAREVAMREADKRLIAAAPDLLKALAGLIAVINDSQGVAGYHLNGDIALWSEFPEVEDAGAAILKATRDATEVQHLPADDTEGGEA